VTAIEQGILDAFRAVQDPCSVAANAPLSVLDMGLVRHWEVDLDGNVRIVISPTFPSCVLIGEIMEQVDRGVTAVPGVASVTVELDSDLMWTPAAMTEDGQAWLEERRTTSLRLVPVRPQQWKEQAPTEVTLGDEPPLTRSARHA
jgi:metal-sulfur cluster biosynthetic enzyme